MNGTIDDLVEQSTKLNIEAFDAVKIIQVGDNKTNKIIAAYFSMIHEYHAAIIKLIELKMYSAAAALLRPIVDALYRAEWISCYADEVIINKIDTNTYTYKNLNQLAEEIDKYNGIEYFKQSYAHFFPALHGLTHGGIEQIGRRFEGNAIGCFFTEKEVVEILVIANSHLIIMLSSISKHFQNKEVRSKVQLLSEKCLTLTNLYLKNKQSN